MSNPDRHPPDPVSVLLPGSLAEAPPVYRVKDLPLDAQPRELFETKGPESVDEAVLIALILRTGAPGCHVLQLAQDMLARYGSLREMARLPVQTLVSDWKGKGLGKVKAQMLRAALEMGRRVAASSGRGELVSTPEQAARVLAPLVANQVQESFWILTLNTRNHLTAPPIEITRGTLNASLVHPREVFRQAVSRAAASIILAHNHPSGDPSPSPEDLRITRELVQAGKVMDVRVLDHVIVCDLQEQNRPVFCSLRESGLVVFDD